MRRCPICLDEFVPAFSVELAPRREKPPCQCGRRHPDVHAPDCIDRATCCTQTCSEELDLLPSDERRLRRELVVALEMLDAGAPRVSLVLLRVLRDRASRPFGTRGAT